MTTYAKFVTPREMAVRLGVSVHLVRSTLEDLADVPPRGFADSTPVYDEAAFARVKRELTTRTLLAEARYRDLDLRTGADLDADQQQAERSGEEVDHGE